MCGIFFIKKNDNISKEKVEKEFNKSKNRGGIPPDDVQFYEMGNYYLGFHRLSINGLDNNSNQPFYKNGIYVICNGEIYNHKELYSKLGIKQLTNSDCEIIIDLYLLYSINYFINILDGVFSFIIYDSRKDCVLVGRDPFGIRPMFCDINYNLFSSELKQISNLTDENIIQFPAGHYLIIDNFNNVKNLYRFHTLYDTNLAYCPQYNSYNSYNNVKNFYCSIIRNSLILAVKKRLLSDRPIACLLSGGLDSSLITSIVVKLMKNITSNKIETYAIGLPGSPDLKYARKVADYLETDHKEILLTENEFFDAIPEVIEKIESYDTTTVRASVGNYLIAKYISQNSKAKVIFNGDGSDELTGGYLYFHKAPSRLSFDNEVKNLLNNIHYFDVLRSDRCISSCGLEPRTPFLDKSFVNIYLSIPDEYRILDSNHIEKKLLRDSFTDFLPQEILYRKKEAFSDGVSAEKNSWYSIIQNKLNTYHAKNKYENFHNIPTTKEQMYYRDIFEKLYPNRSNVIPYFWMPKWCNTNDPSARTI